MVVDVKIYSWDSPRSFKVDDIDLSVNDLVIVKKDNSLEWGKIEAIQSTTNQPEDEKQEGDFINESSEKILRKVNASDVEIIDHYRQKEAKALEFCRKAVKKYNLPMKLIGVKFSFDGSRMIFAFTADGRIDFRDLVKNLSSHFQRSIRLQQIGSRDQARRLGLIGPCGRELCCRGFQKNNLKNISSRAIYLQQLVHRGNERLSGPCGRLMCCLNFESTQYEELKKGMPNLGEIIKTPKGKGKITNLFILSKKIEVELENGNKERFSVEELI